MYSNPSLMLDRRPRFFASRSWSSFAEQEPHIQKRWSLYVPLAQFV
jgi:hypothetical protein